MASNIDVLLDPKHAQVYALLKRLVANSSSPCQLGARVEALVRRAELEEKKRGEEQQ